MFVGNDPVYAFMDKKRAQGKPYYIYITTGANTFFQIDYGLIKNIFLILISDPRTAVILFLCLSFNLYKVFKVFPFLLDFLFADLL